MFCGEAAPNEVAQLANRRRFEPKSIPASGVGGSTKRSEIRLRAERSGRRGVRTRDRSCAEMAHSVSANRVGAATGGSGCLAKYEHLSSAGCANLERERAEVVEVHGIWAQMIAASERTA